MAWVLFLPLLAAAPADRIRPWSENPRYWQYQGRPVLLLGGSREDNLFQIPDLREQLDLLASVGGNFIRNTMSDRDPGDAMPFEQNADGKYDLTQPGRDYWQRFDNLLRWTAELGIIVQIEVWDRFDYADAGEVPLWQRSPWNPANTLTYTFEQTGFAERYPQPAWRDQQPFFHTIPGMPLHDAKLDLVRGFQERHVATLLEHSLPYGNVLYCMNNETSTDPRWGQYWMRFIRDRADVAGVDVYVTDMFDDGYQPHQSAKVRQQIDQPDVYTFIDISQVNSRTFGEEQWRRIRWVIEQVDALPRPVNHVKIYSDGQTNWGSGTPQDGLERFWRNLLAGSAAVRFHRPGGGIGLNELAQGCIRAARRVEAIVPFWDLSPRLDLLSEREENEAYLAVSPRAYVLFFPLGGSVTVDLTGLPAPRRLRWVKVATGEESGPVALPDGDTATIAAPAAEAQVAVIESAE